MTSMTTNIPTSNDDVIDSRDVIARIEELETEDELTEEDAEELRILRELQDEAEGTPDWTYGEALIRDTYFEDYARELAEEIGAVPSDYSWPASHIDWGAAATALQMDYFTVDFDGVTYWVRS